MDKIKPLSIREILTLHDFLGEYLHEINIDTLDVLEYSHTILKKIIENKKPDVFIKALGLMSKKDFMELVSMDEYERSRLFVECVSVNQLWLLNKLLRMIGYGTS